MSLIISISPRKAFRYLCAAIVLLTAMSTLMITFLYFFRWPEGSPMFSAVKIFWLDTEGNLPTLYQTFALLICAGLLALISSITVSEKESYIVHWKIMAVLFFYLGVDEGAHIHEVVMDIFEQELMGILLVQNKTAIMVIVYFLVFLIIIVFVFSYMRFLLHLPRFSRRLFILSGIIYVGGALGLEIIGQFFAIIHSKREPIYGGLATVEEFMEMIGIAIFIYALLNYLSKRSAELRIHFKQDPIE